MENTRESAEKALQRFVHALTEIEGKEKIEDEDVLKLTSLLSDYSKHPASTEEDRLNAAKELDRIRAMYSSK